MNSDQIKQQISAFIDEYVDLEYKTSLLRAHHRVIPAQMTLRMEALAAWGRSQIHPSSFHSVITEKDRRLAAVHMHGGQMDARQAQQSDKQLLDTAVGKLTKGILGQRGLTSNQLAAIVNHQPLRASIPRRQLTQAQKDAAVREVTKAFDPKGNGWGEKEYARRMDELTDANDAEFSILCRKYRAPVADLRMAANQWKTKRIEIGVKRRRLERDGEAKPERILREVPDSEHRKATLATAMVANSLDQQEQGDSSQFNGLSERNDIHPSYLEDSGRRGDIARSFERVERVGYDGGS